MKKKSLISMVVALSLTASVMVGATLAYLTATTGEKVNTFTIGNVNIDLQEPEWDEEGKDDAQNLTPGVTVKKDPTVYNTGANDTYVAVTVDGMEEMTEAGFFATVNAGWVKVNEDGSKDAAWDGKTLEDGIYAYTAVLPTWNEEANGYNEDGSKKNPATPALFSTVDYKGMSYTTNFVIEEVAVDESDKDAGVYYIVKDAEGNQLTTNTFDTESAARSYIDSNYTDNTTVSFDLIVKAFAIQTTGLELETNDVYTWVAEIDFAQ